MYEQAEPVRSPLSGPGSGQTSGPQSRRPTVHLNPSTGRVRYGKGATDKREEGIETSSDAYEEAEAEKHHATYPSADRASQGGASGRRARCSFIRSHRSCMAAATAVVFSLVAVGLVMVCFINKEEISQLSVAFDDLKQDLDNKRNQTTAMGCLGGINKMPEPDQAIKEAIQQLRAEMAAKDQALEQQLETKMAAKDQKIQALEQRPYIERCESGRLEIPLRALSAGKGHRYRDLTATFTRPFRTTPVVTLGFVILDDDERKNLRVRAEVSSKSTTGLAVRIGTWCDSELFRAAIHWMSCA